MSEADLDQQVDDWVTYVGTLSAPEALGELLHLDALYAAKIMAGGPDGPTPIMTPMVAGLMVGLHQRLVALGLPYELPSPQMHTCVIVRRAVEAGPESEGWDPEDWPCSHVR